GVSAARLERSGNLAHPHRAVGDLSGALCVSLMPASTWYRQDGSGWILTIHVQPGARQSGIKGLHGDALKVAVAAAPADGAANAALRKFLAAELGVTLRQVEIRSGQSSRKKSIAIDGLAAEAFANWVRAIERRAKAGATG
ncbi:MAG TPA: DUF167 family protein, partial [Usitatibacteraceae bacterium]|nr:DUF167 family protein [Usitatibacteraceae bacterium]